MSLTGCVTVLEGFIAGFSNATTIMVIFSYAFAFCLERIGVSAAIAYWALSKKVFVNRPWLLITVIVMIAVLISMLGGMFAGIFLLWSVVKAIAEANKMEKGNIIASMLYALILFGGFSGGQMVPFMGGVIMYGGFLTKATGVVVEGPGFLFAGELYTVLSMLAVILVVKLVFRPDASTFILTEEMRQKYAQYHLNNVQKVGLITLIFYFLALLLPSVLKGDFWTMLSSWGIVGMTVIYMTIFAIWKNDKGEAVCSMSDCFTQGVAWVPIMLFMVTIPLANAMESEEVGIIATVNKACMSIFSGMDITLMLILVVIFIGFLTQFLHNLVMAAIFIPTLGTIIIEMGGNPVTFFFVIYAALCCSFATPAASMQAGLIYGRDDVPIKHSYLMGWLYYAVTVVIVIAMIPLCNILFASYMQ